MIHPLSKSLVPLTFLLASSSLLLNSANGQTTILWKNTGTDWNNSLNWNPADIPDTNTEVAQFDGAAVTNPSLSTGTTVRRVEFTAGSSGYTISGASLTIDGGATGDVINISGGTHSFNNAIGLTTTGGGRTVAASSGATLNLNGAVDILNGTDRNIAFTSGGTVNVNSTISVPGAATVNQIQESGAVVNVNAAGTEGTYISFTNTGRLNIGVSQARPTFSGGASGTTGRVYFTGNGTTSSGEARFRGGNNSDLTFGADISGGGTATVSGNLTTENSTRTGATYKLTANTGSTFILSGVNQVNSGANSKIQIGGAGAVRFAGTSANTSSVPIEIASGRLELGKTAGVNAVAATMLTLQSGTELRLLNANQISDTTSVTINSATLNSNGLSESLGTLSLSGSSIFNLGSGSSILGFSSLGGFSAGTLTINGWSGSITGGGTDQIVFTSTAGWTPSMLSQVTFTGYAAGAQFVGNELVAIPEANVSILLLLGLCSFLYRGRKEPESCGGRRQSAK